MICDRPGRRFGGENTSLAMCVEFGTLKSSSAGKSKLPARSEGPRGGPTRSTPIGDAICDASGVTYVEAAEDVDVDRET